MYNCTLDFVPMNDASLLKKQKSSAQNHKSNFITGLFQDKDTILVLALILLLYSDNGDKLLMLALFYIIS